MIDYERESSAGNEKSSKENAAEALDKMQAELIDVRVSSSIVNFEMNKIRIVCDPPPITPPCRPVELPPSPQAVSQAMDEMKSSEKGLQELLDGLQPGASDLGPAFEKGLRNLNLQNKELGHEINKLSKLTDSAPRWDKEKIRKETEKIEKLGEQIERARENLEQVLKAAIAN